MELIFLDRRTFKVQDNGYVDKEYQIIIDSVIPQKSTFTVNKLGINAVVGDIVVVKSKLINYIGIICALEEDEEKYVSKVQTNDFISILDIKVKLASYNGNLSLYLYNLIRSAFVVNLDPLQRFSYLTIARDYDSVSGALTYEADTIDSISSVLNTLSKAYSIGVKYSLDYLNGAISGITLHITTCKKGLVLKSTLAEIKDLVISSSNEQSVNKIVFIPSDENVTSKNEICYYLLKDGTITTNASNDNRIPNVSSMIKIYKDSDFASLTTTAQKEMLISSLEHSIEFNMRLDNKAVVPFKDFEVGDFVEFRTPTKTYTTLVSKFVLKNNLYQVAVTLGEYRISLTDKIKLLTKK